MTPSLEQTSELLEARAVPPAAGVPRPSLRSRLLFAWFVLWATFLTIPLSLCLVVAHQFAPTARSTKRWYGRWGRAVLWGLGMRAEVAEAAVLAPDRPYVFAANHQNALDILVLAAALPYPFGFVAKAELARVPFLGFAIRHSASLYIDRSTHRRSVESLRAAAARIREGNSVLLFPEGARSYAPGLLPFKRGAFVLALEAGVPVVPVTIRDAYRRMDERRWAARSGPIHLVVGEPVPTQGLRRKDAADLGEEVRRRIEAAL